MSDRKSPRAMDGLKVLDFTQGVAGPHATQLMAQSGADVVKIEPLEGEWGRTLGRQYEEYSAHFVAFNRGKRSAAVNLKDPEVLALISEQASKADVIAESFRPGVMKRFGLDYETLCKINPGLVFLSISGFGQQGPYRERPVTDAVIQAFSGWMSINKSSSGLPQRSGMVAMDVMTGLYGFQAVAASLLARFRFGVGKWIDCSLMQSAAAFQVAKVIEYKLQDGQLGNLYAPVGAFETADGIINITAMRDEHFSALCGVMGRADLLSDERFRSRQSRVDNEPALEEILRSEFKKKSARQWAEILTGVGVMNAVVLNYDQLLANEQIKAVSSFDWSEQPELGRVPISRVPGMLANTDPSPSIGKHTAEILMEMGLSSELINKMAMRGAIRFGQQTRS